MTRRHRVSPQCVNEPDESDSAGERIVGVPLDLSLPLNPISLSNNIPNPPLRVEIVSRDAENCQRVVESCQRVVENSRAVAQSSQRVVECSRRVFICEHDYAAPPRPIPQVLISDHDCAAPRRIPQVSIFDPNYAENLRRVERERSSNRRRTESSAQRAERLARNRQMRREREQRDSAAERERFLAQERVRVAQVRDRENEEVEAARIEVERQRAARNVAARGADLNMGAFAYDPETNYSGHPLIDIGGLDRICGFCGARCFRNEPPGLCCAQGKVRLESIAAPPEPWYSSLFSNDTPQSRDFLKNIRRYNDCFRMTSFGVNGTIHYDVDWSTFRVQGQIYHRIGSLLPNPEMQPNFLQVYFTGDAETQLDIRTGLNRDLSRDTVAVLQNLFDSRNDMIRQFRTALEQMPSDNHCLRICADRTPAGEHERRFNAPVAEDEVAIVMIQGPAQGYERDIVIRRRCGGLQRINETHPKYDALQYPITMWRGQDGYHFSIRRIDPASGAILTKKVSAMDFYAYHLMIRGPDQGFALRCGQLLNQFVVDMYAKIEAERLRYITLNQSALRAEDYIHLRDAVATDRDMNDIGQRVILPSSYIGSPRHMIEYAQDAMAYVRVYGRPALFITMTCNPQWREISGLLMANQRPTHRHDITARVFNQKVKKLMQVIRTHQLFGPVRCFMYSVEWQKRGLPHIHLLIWLHNRLRPVDIDSVISAEVPDPIADPVLHRIVTEQMVHGPCGVLNRNSPCMKDNTCSKLFPKPLRLATSTETNGYPLYRRRSPDDGGFTFEKTVRGELLTLDSRWIVPYCPVLSRMFDCHINIECCHSVKSIKYICKYINKGSDMAVVAVNGNQWVNPNDEVTLYQLGRYINTNEAFWRVFSFRVHDRSPAVVKLAVHLENGQRVYFLPENIAAAVQHPRDTTLTAFFQLCQRDASARDLLYPDVPINYIWIASRRIWQARRVGAPAIGRVYTVPPSCGECFFLRLLLHVVRGPTSFEDLRRFEGRVCETYREACLLRGLLESDSHWEQTLREAAATRSPHQLRCLFSLIICSCSPSDPMNLWQNFRQDLSEDILRRRQRENPLLNLEFNDSIYNDALILIEDMCIEMVGKLLRQLGLPAPIRSARDLGNQEIQRELNYDHDEMDNFIAANLPRLVPDQRIAFDALIDAILNGRGGLFFLDAPGGTGKTFLINLILAYIRREGKIILATAASGIAATLLKGGRTAHSTLKLPFDVNGLARPICNISRGTAKARMLAECCAIIWDECTMSHKLHLEAVDNSLKDLRHNETLFGGVVVVLAGDFRQTLPVVPRGTPADELNACLKQSSLWRHVQKFHLSTNMRVFLRGDPNAAAFSQRLLSIGNGTFPSDPLNNIILPNDLCQLVTTTQELIDRVFPNLNENLRNMEWLCERAILAPTNTMVNELNFSIQQQVVSGAETTYLSVDTTLTEEDAINYPVEFLNSQDPPGFPQHSLILKIGSPIICLRNMHPPQLVNGTRLVVKRLMNNCIQATILTGPSRGEETFIPRIPLITSDLPFQFKRLQFPVKLAYAMTINKSQGQSMKVAGILLEEPCFSHGQFYVACSRVGTSANMFVFAPDGRTKNIVYPQALT